MKIKEKRKNKRSKNRNIKIEIKDNLSISLTAKFSQARITHYSSHEGTSNVKINCLIKQMKI